MIKETTGYMSAAGVIYATKLQAAQANLNVSLEKILDLDGEEKRSIDSIGGYGNYLGMRKAVKMLIEKASLVRRAFELFDEERE